jgi:hypothetical protein
VRGVKQILKDLSAEYGVSTEEIEKVVRSQFKMVVVEAAKDTMKPIRLMFIGVFGVKPYRKQIMEEKRKKREDEKTTK